MKTLFALTLLAATPALADCPVLADLNSGIRITESDNTVNLYTAQADGIVQLDVRYPDGYTYRNVLAQGVHVVQLAELDEGVVVLDSIQLTAFDVAPEDLPIPTPSIRWSSMSTVTVFDDVYQEAQSQVWGPEFKLTIGACTYTALAGEMSYKSDGQTFIEGVYYFPDLKISFLHSYDGTIDAPDIFTPVRIEAVQ